MGAANEETSPSRSEGCMITNQEHETTGTARRAAHHMSGRGLVFQVATEVQSLRHDLEFTSGGRAAKTLVKTAGLRLTLVLIKKGFGLNPEATAGGASIEVVEGRLRIHADGRPWDVGAGELIALADNLREPITALEETAFLLTVAWPAGAGAWEQEIASGHV
jgi:quercetin dioxygenase-like cupin family protein